MFQKFEIMYLQNTDYAIVQLDLYAKMRFKTCLYKSYSALVGMSPDTETLELILVQANKL